LDYADADEAPELTEKDFSRARYRIDMQEVSREAWREAARSALGKERISIMLDRAVVHFFKTKAGVRGYQTLINQALCEAMQKEEMETVIRRVIREEMGRREAEAENLSPVS
jgi:uncharacterized protein (DUF4415 family)